MELYFQEKRKLDTQEVSSALFFGHSLQDTRHALLHTFPTNVVKMRNSSFFGKRECAVLRNFISIRWRGERDLFLLENSIPCFSLFLVLPTPNLTNKIKHFFKKIKSTRNTSQNRYSLYLFSLFLSEKYFREKLHLIGSFVVKRNRISLRKLTLLLFPTKK